MLNNLDFDHIDPSKNFDDDHEEGAAHGPEESKI